MNDTIGGAHMSKGENITFTTDRLGNPNSALNLNGDLTYVPPGVYFNSAFTISLWVYLNQSQYDAVFIDFSNGPVKDNILFGQKNQANGPFLHVFSYTSYMIVLQVSAAMTPYQWHFIAVTCDGAFANIYIDGVLKKSVSSTFVPNNVIRTKNYIGRSSWNAYQRTFAFIDELRFYKRGLDITEINKLMTLKK